MMADAAAREDTSSPEYQRLAWDSLRKRLNGVVNKATGENLRHLLPELFRLNLVRGRGLLCQALLKAQVASPGFTPVYAALVAVVNTKLPEVGELLCVRLLSALLRAYSRGDKAVLTAASRFAAHLVNQGVLHEVVALELLVLLLERPTDDSVEVAVAFCKQVGAFLQDAAPRGLHAVFERLRALLHEGEGVSRRTQYVVEGLFAVRKAGFEASGFPAVDPALDLVEADDQVTHEISLESLGGGGGAGGGGGNGAGGTQPELNVFRVDPEYEAREREWAAISREILGEEDEDEEEEGEDDDDDDDDEEEEQGAGGEQAAGGGAPTAPASAQQIADATGTNLVNLRRTIYLTIMSSLDFEEAGHKLMKIAVPQGLEAEVPVMIIECCSQERTYVRYYGLLAARFCSLRREYRDAFADCFAKQYGVIHRLETNKLRNVAKLYAHVLSAGALPWHVLSCVRLTEEDTTSASRIFVKYLFQELSEIMGLAELNAKLQDPLLLGQQGEGGARRGGVGGGGGGGGAAAVGEGGPLSGLFPQDSTAHLRFAINFFTSIGLGGVTDRARALYKELPKLLAARAAEEAAAAKRAREEEREREKRERRRERGSGGGGRGRSRSRTRSRSPTSSSYTRSSRSTSRSYSTSSRSRSYSSRSRSRSTSSRSRSYSSRSRSRSRSRSPSSSRSRSRSYSSRSRSRSYSSRSRSRSRSSSSRSRSRSRSPRRGAGGSKQRERGREERRGRSRTPPREIAAAPAAAAQQGGGGNGDGTGAAPAPAAAAGDGKDKEAVNGK
jgi:pre-mRNA-splicing factor CWC22